jgi:hypothetical protein
MKKSKIFTAPSPVVDRPWIVRIATLLLTAFLCACGSTVNTPTNSGPGLSWQKVDSPLFANTWPPTADTVWVRYTFAYGNNPTNLADGTYVTRPLAKTEWRKGTAVTTALSDTLSQAATQGVQPLDDQALKILQNEKSVADYCLTLTGLPGLTVPETPAMLSYYQTWFKYNGAFLDLIRADHADFVEWIKSNK